MSKNNNVNPGQYKVGGREKPDTIAKERQKQQKQTKTKTRSGGAKKR